MLVIGLTGGIGSGKSAAAKFFLELGVPVYDADVIAKALVQPGQPALAKIVDLFGQDVLTTDGQLDRAKMRKAVFQHPDQRQNLEQLLHPLIREQLKKHIQKSDVPYCVLVIPLLLETHQEDLVQRILVIDAPEEIQLERALARDGTTREEVKRIMASQTSREQRLTAADDVISNSAGLDELKRQVYELHQKYLLLSKPKTA